MKHLLNALVFFVSFASFAQTDSLNRDRTLEGVNKNSSCVVDTSLVLHERVALAIKDSADMSYEFVPGVKTYLEVKIRSTVCWCKDCSFIDLLLIDITDLRDSQKLTASNTTWITWNSFMIPSAEANFTGMLKQGAGKGYNLEIYRFIADKPELHYDGIKVDKAVSN